VTRLFGAGPWTVRRALLHFVGAAAVALVCVTIATALLAHQLSNDLALRHAKVRGTTFAEAVSGPLVDGALRRGDSRTLRTFTQVMENRLKDRSIEHIKVWDHTGRILWADEPGLRGRVFPLDRSVRRLFTTRGTVASVSDLQDEDNVLDHADAPLLEVYVGTHGSDGLPVVVESYWSTDDIDEDARAIMLHLGVLPLGALLVFTVLLLPLAYSFAGRVHEAQAESKRSLLHSLAASDLERRRIARDLHDGVMQDVGGAGYALDAASRSLPPDAEVPRRLITEVSTSLQHVGESLRVLLADIYPPNLARDGLVLAVLDLAGRSFRTGLVVDVDADGPQPMDLPLEVVQLCYRVIREALRNVQRHAEATEAWVYLTWGADAVTLSVTDNGRGLHRPAQGPEPAAQEHLGLRLLDDTVRDVGGSLRLQSPPDGEVSGTRLTATVPRHVIPA
jgi:signal transduction histidine kinase